MDKIHSNIKKFRKAQGLTQEELAVKLETTKQTIQRYETGEIKSIPYQKIKALAEVFGITPGELMGFESMEEKAVDYTLAMQKNPDLFLLNEQIRLHHENKDFVARMLEYSKMLSSFYDNHK